MAVEVMSSDAETNLRDRVDKPRAHAESGIPIYLPVDRESSEITIHSEPAAGKCTSMRIVPIGKPATTPAPVDLALDTEELENYVR